MNNYFNKQITNYNFNFWPSSPGPQQKAQRRITAAEQQGAVSRQSQAVDVSEPIHDSELVLHHLLGLAPASGLIRLRRWIAARPPSLNEEASVTAKLWMVILQASFTPCRYSTAPHMKLERLFRYRPKKTMFFFSVGHWHVESLSPTEISKPRED